MAFYTLNLPRNEQVPFLSNILTTVISAESNLIIVTKDGRNIFSHKELFCIFSKTFSYFGNCQAQAPAPAPAGPELALVSANPTTHPPTPTPNPPTHQLTRTSLILSQSVYCYHIVILS